MVVSHSGINWSYEHAERKAQESQQQYSDNGVCFYDECECFGHNFDFYYTLVICFYRVFGETPKLSINMLARPTKTGPAALEPA